MVYPPLQKQKSYVKWANLRVRIYFKCHDVISLKGFDIVVGIKRGILSHIPTNITSKYLQALLNIIKYLFTKT